MINHGTKFEVTRFDVTNNFVLWLMRVKYILALQNLEKVLNETKSTDIKDIN